MEPSPTKGSLDAKRTIGKSGIEEGALRKAQITEEQTDVNSPFISHSSYSDSSMHLFDGKLGRSVHRRKMWGEKTHITHL